LGYLLIVVGYVHAATEKSTSRSAHGLGNAYDSIILKKDMKVSSRTGIAHADNGEFTCVGGI
jgi:hypothetical protein